MVAALLFHKFLFIGLLTASKQWGYTASTTNVTINLPISFSIQCYGAVALQNVNSTTNSTNNVRLLSKTKSSLMFFGGDNSPIDYIAFGR